MQRQAVLTAERHNRGPGTLIPRVTRAYRWLLRRIGRRPMACASCSPWLAARARQPRWTQIGILRASGKGFEPLSGLIDYLLLNEREALQVAGDGTLDLDSAARRLARVGETIVTEQGPRGATPFVSGKSPCGETQSVWTPRTRWELATTLTLASYSRGSVALVSRRAWDLRARVVPIHRRTLDITARQTYVRACQSFASYASAVAATALTIRTGSLSSRCNASVPARLLDLAPTSSRHTGRIWYQIGYQTVPK